MNIPTAERTGYDALADAAAMDALYGKVICSDGPQCRCPRCRPGDPDDFYKPTAEELARLQEEEREFWAQAAADKE